MAEIEKKLELISKFEESAKLEGFLNSLQQALNFDDELYAKLMLVVSEAVTNAIMHGNKEDESKKVFITAQSDSEELTFIVKDEGEGFDPDSLPDPLDEENLLKTSGRGVFLMEEYADQVSFSNNGSTLTLKFNLSS